MYSLGCFVVSETGTKSDHFGLTVPYLKLPLPNVTFENNLFTVALLLLAKLLVSYLCTGCGEIK